MAGEVSKKRPAPELMTVGRRQIISNGRWVDALIADYVILHGKDKWLTVGDLAKVAWGQNTPTTQQRARKCLSKLFLHMMDRGHFVVIEYQPPHNRAQAVKMFDRTSEQQRQALETKLGKMARNKEISAERYEQALHVLNVEQTP